MQLGGPLFFAFRDLQLLRLAAFGGELVHRHLQEIDDGVEFVALIEGVLHQNGGGPETVPDRLYRSEIVGFGMIRLVDGEDRRFLELLDIFPVQLGAHLHPVLGVDQHHRRIGHPQGGDYLADKVVQAGGVDNVDLVVPPVGMEQGGVNRVAALMFDLVIIGDGVLVLHRAPAIGEPGLEDHGFGQGGFAGLDTAEQDDVFDVLVIIKLHAPPLDLLRLSDGNYPAHAGGNRSAAPQVGVIGPRWGAAERLRRTESAILTNGERSYTVYPQRS